MKAIFVLTFLLSSAFFAVGQETGGLLAPSRTVSLPLVQGGLNHMSVDARHERLFVAAPSDKILEVIDLKAGKLLLSLEGERPAAALYAPEFDQLYVSRGQGVSIYDGKTLKLLASIDLQTNADELRYDPRARELYAGCMGADKTGIAIIAIPEGKLQTKIALPGKPQGFAVEQNGSRIFANLPDQRQIAVLDRKKRLVLQPWPLQNVQGNTPIALDEASKRLFVGARRPATLVVLDTGTGEQVAEIGIDGDTDDLFYDSGNRRIYVSCGVGFIDVIQQDDADHYRLLGRIATASGARTSTFSAQLNKFFLGAPRRVDQPAEIRIFEAVK